MKTCERLTVYYDAACPVCSLEIDTLAARDRDGRLELVDISAEGFNAVRHGLRHADLDAAMHVRRADGSVERGMAAIRLLYSGAGLGWLVRPTAWPGLDRVFDALYRGFARRRRRISRSLAPVIRRVRARRGLDGTGRGSP